MAKGWGIVQDSQGNAIEDCVVKVYAAGTSTLASIFSDSALSVVIDQVNAPVETDATGHYQFFVAVGTYKIVGTKGSFTFTEDNVDIGFGPTDHGALTGLADDDHSQYPLLAGRSGGQSLHGGSATGEDLTLQSNPSKDGSIFFGDNSAFNQAAESLGIGTASPAVEFEVIGRIDVTRAGSPRIGLKDTSTGQTFLLLNTASSFRVFHSQAGTSPFQVDASAPSLMLVIQSTGKISFGPGSPRWCGYTTAAADPTTTELPNAKDYCIHKNTSSGAVFLAFNDGGTIKKVQLT